MLERIGTQVTQDLAEMIFVECHFNLRVDLAAIKRGYPESKFFAETLFELFDPWGESKGLVECVFPA